MFSFILGLILYGIGMVAGVALFVISDDVYQETLSVSLLLFMVTFGLVLAIVCGSLFVFTLFTF